MSIPFDRSTRSMKHDRFLPGMIAVVLISLVLVLWAGWFFIGELSVYATTTDYKVQEDGQLLVTFPATSLAQLQPGQQAELILPAANGQSPTLITAEVMKVPTDAGEGVTVYLFGELPQGAAKGQLKVKTGTTSPARIVWQSMQQ